MAMALASALPVFASGRAEAATWHNIDVTGTVPSLAFRMTEATTGRPVTAADFRGKIVMLYFGYTNCPDVCPLTMNRVALILRRLGKSASQVRVLFVTVDPNRDTLPLLKRYTSIFSPLIVGLRGSPDELAKLARRYRIAYSVSPATKTHPYEVNHSSAIYVFDAAGNPAFLVPSLATTTPDLDGTVDDLAHLLRREHERGLLTDLRKLL